MSLFGGDRKYKKEKKKFDKFMEEHKAFMENPASVKVPKAPKNTKKEQKKALENLLKSDGALETYLLNKKKKAISGVMKFDLLDEADILRLDERIKSYKKKKKEEEITKSEKENELKEKEIRLEKEKSEAAARNQIYCDYHTMQSIMTNSNDFCPICKSALIRDNNKYEARVKDIFDKFIGYTVGYFEARPRYVYEVMERDFPANSFKCPQCEYTVMSARYMYYEKVLAETIDITDTDSIEYRRTKERSIYERYNYRSVYTTAMGLISGRLYSSDIQELARLALPYRAEKVYMNTDAFHEKKPAKKPEPTVTVSPLSMADEIAKFYDLKEKGIISEEDFEQKKKELLSK